MKKFITMIMATAMVLSMTSCIPKTTEAPETTPPTSETTPTEGESDQPSRELIMGHLVIMDDEISTLVRSLELRELYGMNTDGGLKGKSFPTYNNMSEMLLALDAQKVDYVGVPLPSARFLKASNEDLDFVANTAVVSQFSMATLRDNPVLCDRLSEAIDALEADGTIADLRKTYIEEMNTESIPMPKFEGAETIRVVVTGDMPPMEYMAADGTPAGFNTALLSAISNYMKVNFVLVSADSGAREAMLASGKADAIFRYCSFGGALIEQEYSTVNVTSPYFSTYESFLYKPELTKLDDILKDRSLTE